MSGLTMIVVGLVLGLAGGWSIRTVLMLVGFGAGWLLANVFDASFLVTLVIALVAALFAWLIVRLAASIVFFIVGALVGLLVGARLFRLLEGGDGNLLLAIVFIPAIGIAGGWLAEKTKERFVAWGTSIGGAALVLAGIGVLVSGLEDVLKKRHQKGRRAFLSPPPRQRVCGMAGVQRDDRCGRMAWIE